MNIMILDTMNRMKYKRDTRYDTDDTTQYYSTLFFFLAGPGSSSSSSSPFGAGFGLGLDFAFVFSAPSATPLAAFLFLGGGLTLPFVFFAGAFLFGESSPSLPSSSLPPLLLSVGLPSSDVTDRKSSSSELLSS